MITPVMCWDAQPPMGVSTRDHYASISVYLWRLLQSAGGHGVFVVSPLVAAIIESHSDFVSAGDLKNLKIGDGPTKIGTLCGEIEVCVDVSVMESTVCLYDVLDGYVIGRMQIVNLMGRCSDWTALDYLAKL